MNRLWILLSLFVLLLVSAAALCIGNHEVRLFVKMHTVYREYRHWKFNGGPPPKDLYEPLMHDAHRDDMVRGLPIAEILRKFPFLTPGENFANTSYKSQVLYGAQDRDKLINLYWFNPQDGFGWAVKTIDGIGHSIGLHKG